MTITAKDLQAEFGSHSLDAKVSRELPPYGGSKQYWWVDGLRDGGGRGRHIETTASDNAATQAAAVLAALIA